GQAELLIRVEEAASLDVAADHDRRAVEVCPAEEGYSIWELNSENIVGAG
ncbi:hypothetical protein GW866_03960, partial [bacterium]|nr:hypothetical protein [bacterium]